MRGAHAGASLSGQSVPVDVDSLVSLMRGVSGNYLQNRLPGTPQCADPRRRRHHSVMKKPTESESIVDVPPSLILASRPPSMLVMWSLRRACSVSGISVSKCGANVITAASHHHHPELEVEGDRGQGYGRDECNVMLT